MSLFKKFVELGRVIHVTKGVAKDRLAVIVDIIDSNRLLVDGPRVHRQECKLKDARLTKFKLNISHNLPVKILRQKWEKANIEARYHHTPYAKRKHMLRRREQVTDFGYFKMRHAQRKCSNIIYNAFRTLRSREPRTLPRLEKDRKHAMSVKLGYKKVKVLTPEEKKKRADKKVARFQAITKMNEALYKKLVEKRAKAKEARKTMLAKKTAAGKLKPREKVPKDKRKKKATGKKGEVRVNRAKVRRRHIDADRKKMIITRKAKAAKKETEKKPAA